MSPAPSNSPEVGFIKLGTGHPPAGNEVCHVPHSPVWQDWGVKSMELGWIGQQGSIGDSGPVQFAAISCAPRSGGT